jgi:hypothetical protein
LTAFDLTPFKNPLFFHSAIADQLAISHTQRSNKEPTKSTKNLPQSATFQ